VNNRQGIFQPIQHKFTPLRLYDPYPWCETQVPTQLDVLISLLESSLVIKITQAKSIRE